MRDHEYSVIGHSRSNIGRYLGILTTIVVSLLPALGFGLSELLSNIGLSDWSKYVLVIPITAGAIYFLIHGLFNKYGWLPLSYLSQIPNIGGRWECSGKTIGENSEILHNWSATITISQTWEKIRVRLETITSSSHSVSVALIPEPDGCWMLMYSYRNDPKIGNRALNAHLGYAEMRINKGLKTASGEYFTAKGRGSCGTMEFTRSAR